MRDLNHLLHTPDASRQQHEINWMSTGRIGTLDNHSLSRRDRLTWW